MITALFRKFTTFRECSKLFHGPIDVIKYAYIKLFPVRFPKEISIRIKGVGHSLVCRPGTSDVGTIVAAFMKKYHRPMAVLRQNAVIMDLGSNVGYTIVDLAISNPTARIIGVEMDAENHAIAMRNIKPYSDRCVLLHAALWVEDGEVSYVGGSADGFHVDGTAGGGCSVRSRSLDSIAKEFKIEEVDYMKMDIEGAERDVICGATPWACAVHAINVETHSPEIYEAVEARLRELDYNCVRSTSHWASIFARKNAE